MQFKNSIKKWRNLKKIFLQEDLAKIKKSSGVKYVFYVNFKKNKKIKN